MPRREARRRGLGHVGVDAGADGPKRDLDPSETARVARIKRRRTAAMTDGADIGAPRRNPDGTIFEPDVELARQVMERTNGYGNEDVSGSGVAP